jgi:hypothetical protein
MELRFVQLRIGNAENTLGSRDDGPIYPSRHFEANGRVRSSTTCLKERSGLEVTSDSGASASGLHSANLGAALVCRTETKRFAATVRKLSSEPQA